MADAKRYRDNEGDIWEERPNNQLLLVVENGQRLVDQDPVNRSEVTHWHGPLVEIDPEPAMPLLALDPASGKVTLTREEALRQAVDYVKTLNLGGVSLAEVVRQTMTIARFLTGEDE